MVMVAGNTRRRDTPTMVAVDELDVHRRRRG
jgi:hypothetical protein